MPAYTSYQASFTPSVSQDNYTLEANDAGDKALVKWVSWGGRLTVSTSYQTRWVRPTTAGSSTFTALATENANPRYSPLCRVGTFATAPSLPSAPDALHLQDWNAHGGVGLIVLPLGAEWEIINGLLTNQLSCRNGVGTDANGSSYGISWEE